MRIKKRKIHFENILTALLFIIGFYIGIATIPSDSRLLFNLSANAAMTGDAKPVSLFNDFNTPITSVIPTHPLYKDNASDSANPQDSSESPSTTDTDYTPQAPILASNSGKKIEIKNDSGYEIDTENLLSIPIYLRKGDVKVLIIHTHTSEAYAEAYSANDSYRSENDDNNVISVGNIIEKVLKEQNIGVIHDKTYHDYPSYSGAYRRALDTIQANLEKNPSITLVLDIHRDAISDGSGNYMKTLAEINGESCAQGLIVIGTDAGGLEHPSWRENLKFGLRLQKIMCEKYPSFARPLHLRSERFNGHVREGAMILEIGSNGNTLEEAQRAAFYMGDCIASLINSLESR